MTSKRRARRELFRRTVSAVTLVAFVVSQTGALAGPVADPTAPIGFRPSVSTAPSGASVVNIVAPSAAGTSHNKYSTFEVDAKGVVLNNSLGAGASVLAGALGANPRLSGSFATVILNEVTGLTASQLGGALEVFGNAASVIIANPNGVTCAGCSFLNAPRVMLTTGVPFNTGSALGFEVTGGSIGVAGAGLDASNVARL
ncbi:MAG: filamentous hemagglutinin N-terminal domain-containing protein, partial [Gammaproteobacteria bacterium]|nr:filamentous hemagglutinin N-terminal domain-containing protein [Gammaproteobacteria bacterium]